MPIDRRVTRADNISSEQRLMADLLWRYENSVRPVYNSSKSVVVGLGLTLTQILDLVSYFCNLQYRKSRFRVGIHQPFSRIFFVFSAKFRKSECNTTFDWLNHMV